MSIQETIADLATTIAENSPRVYAAGESAGNALGLQTAYDDFWDVFQDFGDRPHYASAFAYFGWTDQNYNPKYPITPRSPNGLNGTFNYNIKITDTKVPITAFGNCANAFANAQKLKRIPSLIWSSVTNVTNMFLNCTDLEEIICSGTLAITGVTFQFSDKLNKASIESIVNCLSSTTSGLTITLSLDAVNKAFETSTGANDGDTSAEFAALIATKPNWTISRL